MKSHIDLVLMADTHELHRELDVPSGDVLIHAGDFTMFSRSESAIRDFNAWLGELPHRHKLVVPGNHEFFLEADPSSRRLLSNAQVLIDQGIEIAGLRFWGSPVTPSYGGAFGLSTQVERERHWARMARTDVLITHGPPEGIMDQADAGGGHIGDPELRETVRRTQPLLHVFGHVHGAYGQLTVGETRFINCALLGFDGSLSQQPVRIRIPRR